MWFCLSDAFDGITPRNRPFGLAAAPAVAGMAASRASTATAGMRRRRREPAPDARDIWRSSVIGERERRAPSHLKARISSRGFGGRSPDARATTRPGPLGPRTSVAAGLATEA